jgi:cytochrome c oxidase assembly protein subunit 15
VTADPNVFRGLLVAHIILAFFVMIGSLLLAWICQHRAYRDIRLLRCGVLLLLAVVIQIGLGLATWTVKYGWPWFLGDFGFAAQFVIREKGFLQINLTTGHVATGSLILGVLTVIVCRSVRARQIACQAGRIANGVNASLLKQDESTESSVRPTGVTL